MEKPLLQIGCDSGLITLKGVPVNGIFFYKLVVLETSPAIHSQGLLFIRLQDSWNHLKARYPKWYRLYLIDISAQMVNVLKSDFLSAPDKDEYTQERWLEQLTGYGLGF
ncbi:hypothetical protein GCM10027037_12520 [Mucilaginibacter koreensis]